MNVSANFAAGPSHAASHQGTHSASQNLHKGRQNPSITDIDAQGSSIMSAPSATGKVGSKINITA
jgi:hypothetical protein